MAFFISSCVFLSFFIESLVRISVSISPSISSTVSFTTPGILSKKACLLASLGRSKYLKKCFVSYRQTFIILYEESYSVRKTLKTGTPHTKMHKKKRDFKTYQTSVACNICHATFLVVGPRVWSIFGLLGPFGWLDCFACSSFWTSWAFPLWGLLVLFVC